MIDDLKLDLAKLKDYDNFAKNLRDDKTGEIVKTNPLYYMEFSSVSPEIILLGLELIFPELVQYDDCIFLKIKFSEEKYYRYIKTYNRDKEFYENCINTIKLLDIFNQEYADNTYSYSIDYLGKVMEKSWKRELEHRFKDRRFHVEYYQDINDGQMIYFHTIRE